MVEYAKGIPDDSPENTVKAIEEILREEAVSLGGQFARQVDHKGIAIEATFDVALGPGNFRIYLSFVERHNLERAAGSIGNGFISAPPEHWNLELLPKDVMQAPMSPPFRWGLYRQGESYLDYPPSHILDGALLRQLLRQALTVPPPA